MPDEPEVTDPRLQSAAGLLKSLPEERPPASMAAHVVEQVRPVAARRRRIYLGIALAALASVLVWAAVFYSALNPGEGS